MEARRATRADFEGMREVYEAGAPSVAANYPGRVPSWDELDMDDKLRRDDLYVALDGNRLVGWVAVKRYQEAPEPEISEAVSDELYLWWLRPGESKRPILYELFSAWYAEMHKRGVLLGWGLTPATQDAESLEIVRSWPEMTEKEWRDGWTLWLVDVALANKERFGGGGDITPVR